MSSSSNPTPQFVEPEIYPFELYTPDYDAIEKENGSNYSNNNSSNNHYHNINGGSDSGGGGDDADDEKENDSEDESSSSIDDIDDDLDLLHGYSRSSESSSESSSSSSDSSESLDASESSSSDSDSESDSSSCDFDYYSDSDSDSDSNSNSNSNSGSNSCHDDDFVSDNYASPFFSNSYVYTTGEKFAAGTEEYTSIAALHQYSAPLADTFCWFAERLQIDSLIAFVSQTSSKGPHLRHLAQFFARRVPRKKAIISSLYEFVERYGDEQSCKQFFEILSNTDDEELSEILTLLTITPKRKFKFPSFLLLFVIMSVASVFMVDVFSLHSSIFFLRRQSVPTFIGFITLLCLFSLNIAILWQRFSSKKKSSLWHYFFPVAAMLLVTVFLLSTLFSSNVLSESYLPSNLVAPQL